MISEKEFASGFGGFWAGCLPFLSPRVIAEFNISGAVLTDSRHKALKPLIGSGDNSQNDVVAETAFGLFAASVKRRKDVLSVAADKETLESIGDSAIRRVQRLGGHRRHRRELIATPMDQAIELAGRLQDYFTSEVAGEKIVVQPAFKGCGILNSCYGDLLASARLYEVKMVDRNLRSVDLRQLLLYCALNYKSQQYVIDSVSVLNPRRGIEFSFVVEELVRRASSKTSAELFHEITEFLSNFETMHHAS